MTQPDYWSASEQEALIKTLAVIINGQKNYGKQVSIDDTFAYYRLKLDGRYPVDRILRALQLYTDTKDDIPTPADLITLMEPPKPKVGHAEFIHAKDQWAKEGYPQFSYYHMIVMQYEKENGDERAAPAPIEDQRVLGIVRDSVKRIS